ncbi:MAG: XisI protein [bacterium]|nr:XisI protein [bacterium]
MESQVTFYQQYIKALLTEYQQLRTPHSCIELLFDDERMRYMVMRVGWHKQKRIHVCLVHIDILDDLVIIQSNNTEAPLAAELVDMGIPREKIGLGFIPPEARQYAEYPVQFEMSDTLHADDPILHAAIGDAK